MNEYALEYAGWEITWESEPTFLAVGFHADGSSLPYAIGGEDADELVSTVEGFSGGWVLFELTDDLGEAPDYEVVDGSEYVTPYGG